MKLNTKEFNKKLKNVAGLVGSNSNMEICDYIELQLVEDMLLITATDNTNIITVRMDAEVEEDETFKELVEGNKLINLVKATTAETIEITAEEKYVKMVGNGDYQLDCRKDEFPEYTIEPDETFELEISDITTLLDRHNKIIADDLTVPELTGYKIGKKVTTLDGVVMAITDKNILDGYEVLIPNSFMKLLKLFEGYDEKVKLMIDSDSLLFENSEITIYGGKLHGLDDFPDVEFFSEEEYENNVTVATGKLSKMLDRLKIFATNEEQEYGIKIKLNNKGLIMEDVDGKAKEKFTKLEIKSNGTFECEININNLLTFVSNIDANKTVLMYNEGKDALKVVGKDVNTEYFASVLTDVE